MPDFRVADTASEHPKMRAAGLAAIGLWTECGAWAMNPAHMTDGWVPLHFVQTWPSGKKLATRLVEVGLWERAERGGQPGYQFHDWLEINRSASDVEEERRKARDRMARIRSAVRPNKPRTDDERSGERAPNVHDSLTLTHTQVTHLGEERPVADVRATRPPDRCPRHQGIADPPNCGQCADARRAAEAWDAAAPRRDAERRAAIRGCRWCDGDGWRWLNPARRSLGVASGPGARCDHTAPIGVSS